MIRTRPKKRKRRERNGLQAISNSITHARPYHLNSEGRDHAWQPVQLKTRWRQEPALSQAAGNTSAKRLAGCRVFSYTCRQYAAAGGLGGYLQLGPGLRGNSVMKNHIRVHLVERTQKAEDCFVKWNTDTPGIRKRNDSPAEDAISNQARNGTRTVKSTCGGTQRPYNPGASPDAEPVW